MFVLNLIQVIKQQFIEWKSIKHKKMKTLRQVNTKNRQNYFFKILLPISIILIQTC